MKQQQLRAFAEKWMREITDGEPVPRRIKLTFEGTLFETWEPIIKQDPEQWCNEVETLIVPWLEELPKRRCQLYFTVEDQHGAVLATLIRSEQGKNATLQDLGTNNGAKALADSMASIQKTVEATLKMSRDMLEFSMGELTKAHERLNKQVDQNQQWAELFQKLQQAELEGAEQENALTKVLSEEVGKSMPMLMQLAQHFALRGMGNAGKGSMAAAAAAAATPNGVVTQ
jgi:hypothetical protein